MLFQYSLAACLIGFALDFVVGDPHFKLHPVRLIGHIISMFEKIFRKNTENNKKAALLGACAVVCTIITCTSVSYVLLFAAYAIHPIAGLAAESITCCFMLSAKSLKKESMLVAKHLNNADIPSARKALSMIVGRDTAQLDKPAIIRAAVETVAENLSDGVIAPLLYMLIGGAVLGVLYKTVNTMDSMLGYKNAKYLYFGKCAARLDDVCNFIPSRVSACLLICAAFVLKLNYKGAVRIFLRDRYNHASPNSAQTESVCAGALGIRLAGNAYYFGQLYEKPYIGDDTRSVRVNDIAAACSMMYTAAVMAVMAAAVIAVIAVIAVAA